MDPQIAAIFIVGALIMAIVWLWHTTNARTTRRQSSHISPPLERKPTAPPEPPAGAEEPEPATPPASRPYRLPSERTTSEKLWDAVRTALVGALKGVLYALIVVVLLIPEVICGMGIESEAEMMIVAGIALLGLGIGMLIGVHKGWHRGWHDGFSWQIWEK